MSSASAASAREAIVAYLELATDARYEPVKIGRLTLEERPRPWAGAALAFEDSRSAAAAAGVTLRLDRASAPDAEALAGQIRAAAARG
ncbi:MAG TPA: hypothetical protein VIL72_09550, partial [Beijerinckiaceae bacterium]